jgi:hypothetical protein
MNNELRIGNWIQDGNEFEQITIDHLNCLYSGRCEYDPITLTEEWLLKFGFEITDNFQTKDRFQTHKQDGIIWFEYGYIVVELNYVHQLQNLYFALTNEELTIKNK